MIRGYSFDGLTTLPTVPLSLSKRSTTPCARNLISMAALATASDDRRAGAGIPGAAGGCSPFRSMLAGCIWAFGLMGFLSLPLTMVTISGLPILIGLGVDFAIQFHSRFDEEMQHRA